MTTNEILIALALLPVIVLMIYIYRQDKYEKEPIKLLLKVFFLGTLCAIPAIILESLLSAFAPGCDFPVFNGLYNGFVVAGFSEELCKLLMLRKAIWKNKDFNEYFDGIVYAAFVSLGFAGLENVMYVFNQTDFYQAISTGAVRAVMSVPGHFLFAVVMGYYFALAKFQPEHRSANMFKALLYPALLHGTFDALLMIPEGFEEYEGLIAGVLFVVFIIFDIKLWKIGTKKLRHLQQLSESQAKETDNFGETGQGGASNSAPEDPFKGIDWNV